MDGARTSRSLPELSPQVRYGCPMATSDRDVPDELTARERARLRARDRKRATPMVVDNAGVKRTALALARKRAARQPGATKDGATP